MKINELPKDIQHRVFELQIAAGNRPDGEIELTAPRVRGGFEWDQSRENWEFWKIINEGMFSFFEHMYPEGVKDPRITLSDVATDILKDCPIVLSDHSYDEMHAHIVKKLEGLI